MRSPKEQSLDSKIIKTLKAYKINEKIISGVQRILSDEEIHDIQEYANHVSIVRLGYNDHGPVHMRIVTHNAIVLMDLLRRSSIKTSLESEGIGSFEDSLVGVIFAALLHDLGMSIGRQDHEMHSVNLAIPILDRLLPFFFPKNTQKTLMIRSLILEGIAGHMGTRNIHSIEAGITQMADGCDMTKGRARIPMSMDHNFRSGHIHMYSANSIEAVKLSRGQEKPINIKVTMSSEAGLFQVEEVLLTKISRNTAKPYIELYAEIQGGETIQYL
ncbi:MAG: phosphohydrolase [Treponema sp.]|nr:phosphohydrolase [Treponema sp.]